METLRGKNQKSLGSGPRPIRGPENVDSAGVVFESKVTRGTVPSTSTPRNVQWRGVTGLIPSLTEAQRQSVLSVERALGSAQELLPLCPEALGMFLLSFHRQRGSVSVRNGLTRIFQSSLAKFVFSNSTTDTLPATPVALAQAVKDSSIEFFCVFNRPTRPADTDYSKVGNFLDDYFAGGMQPVSWGPPTEILPPEKDLRALSSTQDDVVPSILPKATKSVNRKRVVYHDMVLKLWMASMDFYLERTAYATASLVLLLRSIGYRFVEDPRAPDPLGWLARFMDKYLVFASFSKAEAWLKWAIADVSARLTLDPHADTSPADTERPPRPEFLRATETHFLGGPAYVWFESHAGGKTPKQIALALSITNFKKRQPPLPEELERADVAKWENSLFRTRTEGAGFVATPTLVQPKVELVMGLDSVVPPPPIYEAGPDALEAHGYSRTARPKVLHERIRFWAKKICRLIAKKASRSKAMPSVIPGVASRTTDPGLVAPGKSGVFGRAQGGEFGANNMRLLREMGPEHLASARRFLGFSEGAPLPGLYPLPNAETVKAELLEIEGSHGSFCLSGDVPSCLETLSSDVWRDFLETGCTFDVLHTSILEPFKVRNITRSAPLTQRALHDLQKFIHSAMCLIPAFALTRETSDFDLALLANLVIARLFKSGHSFVSGDYTASTDNLNPRVSRIVVEALVEALGLSKRVALLFTAALTGHSFRGQPQTWGQLMGSVVSFPVLCIANLALTLVAFELSSEGGRDVEDCGVLINGDDIGFSAGEAARQMWRRVTTAGGLAQSVGKNYVHRRFLQLNSKTMYYNTEILASESAPVAPLEGSESTLPEHELKGVLEVLWSPQIAVLSPPPTSDRNGYREWLQDVPGLQRRFLEGSAGHERDRLNRLFLACQSYHLSKIMPFSDTINWYVPRALGGFGLEAPGDMEVRLNDGQLRAATWFRDNTNVTSWFDSKVGFSAAPSSTTTYHDAKRVLSSFSDLLEYEFSDRKPSEPFVTGLESTLALTGRSIFWVHGPGALERGFRFVYRPEGVFLSLEERSGDRTDGLLRWSNQLRKAARKAGRGRTMTVNEVLEFKRTLIVRPKDGVTMRSRTLRVDPRTLHYTVRRPVVARFRDNWVYPLLSDLQDLLLRQRLAIEDGEV